jgi:cell division protein FtsX
MPSYISTADIMLIITGIALFLLGSLIATIYVGVSNMVATQFQNLTNQTVPNYTSTTASYVPTILNMVGLMLIIIAVGHIIYTLMTVTKQQISSAPA